MIDVLLPVVLLIGLATLAVAIGALRSSRRSEDLGEDRYELLRDQHDRLEQLREERRMLLEELERETEERRQLMASLGSTPPQFVEDPQSEQQGRTESARRVEEQEQERLRLEQALQQMQEELERERQEHLEAQRRTERLGQEHEERLTKVRQETERLRQERQRLTENLEKEREQRLGVQQQIEQLQREHRRLHKELDKLRRLPVQNRGEKPEARRSWWQKPSPVGKPILVIVLPLGILILWLTSLLVALNLLYP